jgi:hypothetical protein
LIRYANNHELLAMASPKPVMIIAASQDQSFPITGVREVFDYGRDLYRSSGIPERIAFSEDSSTGHGYQQKKREAAYGWFLKWLMGSGDGSPFAEPPTDTPAFDAGELRCFPPGRNEPAGPGLIAVVRKLASRVKPATTVVPVSVSRPEVRVSNEPAVQRLLIPSGDLKIPAFFIRGTGRGVLLALDDAGKEAVLGSPRVAAALKEGWSVYGVDPRGIGELATTQTGWLAAVSLLLDEYFVDQQARDLLTAAAVFEGRPITVYARGPNSTLAAAHALPHIRGLESYTLREGFRSYRDFLERPKSLEASYRLRPNNDERFAYDREIPFLYARWKALLSPDIPDLLKATKALGSIEAPLNGDWEAARLFPVKDYFAGTP